MSRQLPPKPDLRSLHNQAKQLLKAHQSGRHAAIERLRAGMDRLAAGSDAEILSASLTLRDMQQIVAREYGFASWARLLKAAEAAVAHPVAATPMDPLKARRLRDLFIEKAFGYGEPYRALTDIELQFIEAAVDFGDNRWDGTCDVARMEALVGQAPDLLQSVGPALLRVVVSTCGCHESTRFLAERGVPLDIDATRYNALHEAAWTGATENMRAIFEAGLADATGTANPHTGWPDNVSLMYWAAWGGYPKMARLLIEFGAGIHHERPIKGNGERGTTVLHEAVAPNLGPDNQERLDGLLEPVARILIEDGAEYDIYSACGLGDRARVEALLAQNGLLTNAVDPYGMTPLHWAARAGALDCATLLVERGADVDADNRAGRVPLHLATDANREDIVWLLADWGADLNVADKQGRTPLHRATYRGRAEVAEILIALGAKTTTKNKKGKTPLQVARMGASFLKP
ncbi:MAG: hypothetical protein GKR89_36380 [Candidatus Latescibacteria bacterium]|nr:hypothetical protein [Candidatus Latescibacterota bacterium]